MQRNAVAGLACVDSVNKVDAPGHSVEALAAVFLLEFNIGNDSDRHGQKIACVAQISSGRGQVGVRCRAGAQADAGVVNENIRRKIGSAKQHGAVGGWPTLAMPVGTVCPVSQVQFLAVMNGAPPALASPVEADPAAGAVGNAPAQEAAVAGLQRGCLFCRQLLKGLEVVIKL